MFYVHSIIHLIVVVVYCVDVLCSLCLWLIGRCTQISTYSWENPQVLLVGNKCDLMEERVITKEKGRQLATQLGLSAVLYTRILIMLMLICLALC